MSVNVSFLVFDLLLEVSERHSTPTPAHLYSNVSPIFAVSQERVSWLRLTACSGARRNTPSTATTSSTWIADGLDGESKNHS